MMTSTQIRQTFLDFFKSKGHEIVPSAPMVVKNDPTLMFINSGMAPFKDIFLGNAPIKFPRVADTQKCLRVSGKHNDLEEVGVDTYHHTMFEMLGNWSFGDYFKKEAITWAWELLTEVYKIDKSRLYVTVFEGSADDKLAFDQEAYDIWKQFIAEDRIIKGNKKDNFWEMGDTGPCGPCSEIHCDIRTDEERKKVDGKTLVNASHPQVIEIWNNVFMEFNRKADGSLEKLPAQHVDTGMGFERLCVVLQGKQSNYDTDVFQPLIQIIAKLSGKTYGESEKTNIAIRVIADHVRTISFSIADGQLPSNTGAGYVIRRILRRAVRYGYQTLEFKEPFMYKLVPVLANQMGGAFQELLKQQSLIEKVMKEEETSFYKTLSSGLILLDQYERTYLIKQLVQFFSQNKIEILLNYKVGDYQFDFYFPEKSIAMEVAKNRIDSLHAHGTYIDKKGYFNSQKSPITDFIVINIEEVKSQGLKLFFLTEKFTPKLELSGEKAFELFDTFGFPIDLTQLIAREKGFEVDMKGFDKCMQEQKNRSREATSLETGDWTNMSSKFEVQSLKFVGYEKTEAEIEVVQYRKVKAKNKEQFQLVFNQTPFYAESGGQVGDTGYIDNGTEKIAIIDTKKENGAIIHFAEKLPEILTKSFIAVVDNTKRKLTENNHSATHLLHAALRKVLGTHVEQKGSLVNDEYLRFDFSHFSKVTDEEILKIEEIVNEKIRENIASDIKEMPIEEAKKSGAMALFGEKYGDTVRVVTFDKNYSIELCGGTHVKSTGQIGLFKITSESAVAAGIRRIEAITSVKAQEFIRSKFEVLSKIETLLNNPKDVLKSIEELKNVNTELRKENELYIQQKAQLIKKGLINKIEKINNINFLSVKITGFESAEAIKNISFEMKSEIENLFMVLGYETKGKPSLSVIISENLVKEKNMNANAIVRELAKEIQGGGGGQPFYATAGGTNLSGLQNAIDKAVSLI